MRSCHLGREGHAHWLNHQHSTPMEKGPKSPIALFSVSFSQKGPLDPAKRLYNKNMGCLPWMTTGLRRSHPSWLPTHRVLGAHSKPQALMIATHPSLCCSHTTETEALEDDVRSMKHIINQGQNRGFNLSFLTRSPAFIPLFHELHPLLPLTPSHPPPEKSLQPLINWHGWANSDGCK